MYSPSKLDLQFFAAEKQISEDMALRFWSYANSQNWKMRDGTPMENWRHCFLKWCEVVEGPARGTRRAYITDEERTLRNAETLIRAGRRAKASDETIVEALQKRGLTWPQ